MTNTKCLDILALIRSNHHMSKLTSGLNELKKVPYFPVVFLKNYFLS